MSQSIIYMGDDHLGGAASYLAGVMTHFNLDFDHVRSSQPAGSEPCQDRRCLILSDYPARNLTAHTYAAIVDRVRSGMGLLMIGGWESFTGLGRQYTDTPLADVLPVVMHDSNDDRVNSAQPVLIAKVADHPIVAGLPWEQPPGIGGYNRFTAKPGAETILKLQHVTVRQTDDAYDFALADSAPLLVVSQYGSGRVAALATDVAPHWVGGFVDWGEQRIDAVAANAEPVQVGAWYAQFFANLVRWTVGLL